MIRNCANTLLGQPIPDDHWQRILKYSDELEANLEKVAIEAVRARSPRRLSWGIGKVGFAMNRRSANGPVDLYVNSTTGDDNNDGLSPDRAKNSIMGAVQVAPWIVGGMVTIHIADGTYRESVFIDRRLMRGGGWIVLEGNVGNPYDVVIDGEGVREDGIMVLGLATIRGVRVTNFVESGPVFSITREFLPFVTPFSERNPMGWGNEALWFRRAQERNLPLAIVDACPVKHRFRPLYQHYAKERATEDWGRFLREHDLTSPQHQVLRRYPKIYRRRSGCSHRSDEVIVLGGVRTEVD